MSLASHRLSTVAGALLLTLAPISAFGQTIFNSIPTPVPSNIPSFGYEANQLSEMGVAVNFAPGTPRNASAVTVIMSSWGCVTGSWNNGNCATPPGSTFSHPITAKIYSVGPLNSVGTLLTTVTQTFAMPYRPSVDPTCPVPALGGWRDSAGVCRNGFAFPITFGLGGTVLPNQVIISIAFNTTHYGAAPMGQLTACFIGGNNCPYDSLNLGAQTFGPTVGTFVDPTSMYSSSITPGWYCDLGVGGTGTFRLDAGCYAGFLPQLLVVAAPADAFQVRYSSNLAIGESVVNFSNTGASSTGASFPVQNGDICANVFAYSPDEQLVSCCSCNVTPNALNSLSVRADLASNTLTPIIPSSLVIKIVATAGGGACTASTAATVNTALLQSGLAAWGTTLHDLPVTPGSPATTFGVTETPFSFATMSAAELTRMAQLCAFIRANGSGYGICKSCKVGGLGAASR